LGALFFTLTINIITLLGLSTGAGIITSGALTLFAILLYSGWRPFRILFASLRRALQPPARSLRSP
jgi:ribose transport system ATP-binding protein